MLKSSSETIGFAPISNQHINRVATHLTKKGLLNKSDSFETRVEQTIKSLIKSWAAQHLKMGDRGMGFHSTGNSLPNLQRGI